MAALLASQPCSFSGRLRHAGHARSNQRIVRVSRSQVASRHVSRQLRVRAAGEQVETVPLGKSAAAPAVDEEDYWLPVLSPEELPKGVRKEVYVGNRSVLLFWYRNQIFCIEARSPAEGAYSEGFIKSKFTQEYGIECPSTGTVFSLKDGSILDWYPTNPIMKALISPSTCRPLEIFPVKLTQDAIKVDVTKAQGRFLPSKGGAETSLEGNNVLPTQPKVYYDDTTPVDMNSNIVPRQKVNLAILFAGLGAAGIAGVAGTATFVFYEDYTTLALYWVLLLGATGFGAYKYLQTTTSTSN